MHFRSRSGEASDDGMLRCGHKIATPPNGGLVQNGWKTQIKSTPIAGFLTGAVFSGNPPMGQDVPGLLGFFGERR